MLLQLYDLFLHALSQHIFNGIFVLVHLYEHLSLTISYVYHYASPLLQA